MGEDGGDKPADPAPAEGGKPADGQEPAAKLEESPFDRSFKDDKPEDKPAEAAAEDKSGDKAEEKSPLPDGVDPKWEGLYKSDPEFAAKVNEAADKYDRLAQAAGDDAENLELLVRNKDRLMKALEWQRGVGERFTEFQFRYGRGDISGAMDLLKDLGVKEEHLSDFYTELALAKGNEAEEPGSLDKFRRSRAVSENDINLFRRNRELEAQAQSQERGGFTEGEIRSWRERLAQDPYVAEYNKRMGAPRGDLNRAAAAIDRYAAAMPEDKRDLDAAWEQWRGELKSMMGDLEAKADPAAAEKRPESLSPPSAGEGGGSPVETGRKYYSHQDVLKEYNEAVREEARRRAAAAL